MAGTIGLTDPSPAFNSLKLDILQVAPARLCRVSRRSINEPHFGRTGSCRFDDPAKRYGTCYLGLSLLVAFAESVLHNAEPTHGGFDVPFSDIATRFALSFKGPKLNLAQVHGAELMCMGGNGEVSGSPDYTLPQAWSAALEAHPAQVDGFIYMSRRINDAPAVVLFERTPGNGPAIQMTRALPLSDHKDYDAVVSALRVRLI